MVGDIVLDGREWNRSFTLSLKKMQEAGLLCDSSIQCSDIEEDEVLLAHSCVLAASSPNLKESLLKQAATDHVGVKQVDGMGFDKIVWKYLLEFMYKSKVVLPVEHRHYLKEIEEAAMALSLKGLIDAVTLALTRNDDEQPAACSAESAEESFMDDNEEKETMQSKKKSTQTSGARSTKKKASQKRDAVEMDNESEGRRLRPARKRRRPKWARYDIGEEAEEEEEEEVAVEENETEITDDGFICEVCDGKFPAKRALQRHMKNFHPELKKFFCTICASPFNSNVHLEDHNRKVHKAKLLECVVCYKEFITKDAWRRHHRLYHPNVKDIGENVFNVTDDVHEVDESVVAPILEQQGINDLIRSSQENPNEQTVSLKSVKVERLDGYDDSIGAEIDDADENIQTVTFKEASSIGDILEERDFDDSPNFVPSSVKKRVKHEKGDKDLYSCTECPKTFISLPGLTNHQSLIHPDKYGGDYKCDECGRPFGQRGQLEDHMRVKHDAEPLKCERCPKTFKTRDAIYRHERFKHHMTNRRKFRIKETYKCGECDDLEFKHVYKLEDHQRKEHGAPPLVCEICGASFTQRDSFYRHNKYVHVEKMDVNALGLSVASTEEIDAHKEATEWKSKHSKFKCSICNYPALSKFVLQEHMKKHSDEKHYECTICKKLFKYKVGLYNHQARHHPKLVKGNFKCADCNEIFGRSVHLDDHMRLKHGAELLRCEHCDKDYKTKDAMYRHVRVAHPGKFKKRLKVLKKCNQCKYTTLSNAAYQIHLMTHSNIRPFICEICGMDFKYKGDLAKHNKTTHDEDYVPETFSCDQCGLECRNKKILRRHYISRHQKEFARSFPCNFCGKDFGSKTNRDDHIRIEHVGQQILCQFCNMEFTDINEWYDHKQVEHPDMATRIIGHEDTYACGICRKEFKKIALLRRHERYHVTIRPFKCDICNSTFVAKEDLQTHYKVHSGNKPFSCPQCSFRTLRKPTLTQHMRKHNNQMLQCPKCEKVYQQMNSLKKHLKVHHEMAEEDELLEETLKAIAESEKQKGDLAPVTVVPNMGSKEIKQLPQQVFQIQVPADMDISQIVKHASQHLKTEDKPSLEDQSHVETVLHVPDVGDTMTVMPALHTTEAGDINTVVEHYTEEATMIVGGEVGEQVIAENIKQEDQGMEESVSYITEGDNQDVVYIMADESQEGKVVPEVHRGVENGQEVMYIKLGEDQYVQVMDPSSLVQME